MQSLWDDVLEKEGLDLRPMAELLLPVEQLERIAARREMANIGEPAKPKLYDIMRMSLRDVDNLSKRARKIIKLKAKKIPHDKIAQIVGLSVRGVEDSLARTRARLLKKFKERVKRFDTED